MDMKNLRNATAGLALLLAASGTAFAEDTHHANQPGTQTTPAAPGMFPSGMPMSGMQGQGGMMAMMNMMNMMDQAGMTPMMAMMGPNGTMTFGMMDSQGQPAIMMSGFGNEFMGMPTMPGGFADHIDGRIAYLKAELKITEAQAPQWNAFADALRSSAAQARHLRAAARGRMMPSGDLPARLASQEQSLRDRLDLLHQEGPPLLALYVALSDEQKRTADQLLAAGGMGM
jgi:hypothetical protein